MGWRVMEGDCLDLLAGLEAASVDAIVTDPPYELGFMGREWDSSGIAFRPAVWAAALRVLRPGGHLVAFGGTRTAHRIVCAIEDAGFQIRDTLAWLYGSGFPKSLDVSKAIDKAAGAEREVMGRVPRSYPDSDRWGDPLGSRAGGAKSATSYEGSPHDDLPGKLVTAPATPDAERWQGWGTALKPAFEPITLARAPLSESGVAANVVRHGTGGLNIDACRLEADPDRPNGLRQDGTRGQSRGTGLEDRPWMHGPQRVEPVEANPAGRWPPNVALDEAAAELLDEQSGELTSGANPTRRGAAASARSYGGFGGQLTDPQRGVDVGGASRFMYVAKAPREERERGLSHRDAAQVYGPDVLPGSLSRPMRNPHPTVKPVELMRWLCRLVTPPGGVVLDPFTGSGTTGVAALREGLGFIGMERDPEYVEVARDRIRGDAPLFNVGAEVLA